MMGFATIEGLQIRYRAAGDPRAGQGHRVLYVHGTGCNGRVWEHHMEAIAADHTPVAIDLPGHGDSQGDGFRGVADYAHFAIQLADALAWDRFVLAGHSLGGGVALAAALYRPDRLAGLLLIDTGARLRVDPEYLAVARRAAAGEAVPSDRRLGFAAATPQAVVDAVFDLTADTDPRVTYKDWIADDTCDFMARIGAITLPSLALCGEGDPLTPVKYHEFLRDRMPNCALEVIRGAGHWPFAEQPEAFDRVVQSFLRALP